jgi:hypothetical protein
MADDKIDDKMAQDELDGHDFPVDPGKISQFHRRSKTS